MQTVAYRTKDGAGQVVQQGMPVSDISGGPPKLTCHSFPSHCLDDQNLDARVERPVQIYEISYKDGRQDAGKSRTRTWRFEQRLCLHRHRHSRPQRRLPLACHPSSKVIPQVTVSLDPSIIRQNML